MGKKAHNKKNKSPVTAPAKVQKNHIIKEFGTLFYFSIDPIFGKDEEDRKFFAEHSLEILVNYCREQATWEQMMHKNRSIHSFKIAALASPFREIFEKLEEDGQIRDGEGFQIPGLYNDGKHRMLGYVKIVRKKKYFYLVVDDRDHQALPWRKKG